MEGEGLADCRFSTAVGRNVEQTESSVAEDKAYADQDVMSEKIYMSQDFIKMMWRRTRFLLDVLRRGYNFVFTVRISFVFPLFIGFIYSFFLIPIYHV